MQNVFVVRIFFPFLYLGKKNLWSISVISVKQHMARAAPTDTSSKGLPLNSERYEFRIAVRNLLSLQFLTYFLVQGLVSR